MLKIEFDLSALEKRAMKIVGAAEDQVPFALSLALNKAADVTRGLLIQQTWPQHVHVRNTSFLTASLTTKDARASKTQLDVEIYDKLDRGHLRLHAIGGQRTPHGGSNLAVPSSERITRTSMGVPKAQRPRVLKNAFVKGDVVYQRIPAPKAGRRYVFRGAGQALIPVRGARLRLMYVLKPQTTVPRAVPFYEDFEASMLRELTAAIPDAMRYAMATRR